MHLKKRSVILVVSLIAVLALGMFVYTSIKRAEEKSQKLADTVIYHLNT